MKTFTAGFAAEKNKKTGPSPTWILSMTVGGINYYIGDSEFSIDGWKGGVNIKPWVSQWGQLMEGILGAINEIRIADFTVTFVIDSDANPNMEHIATSPDLEANTVELYLWFHGLDPLIDPPLSLGRYYVKDPIEIPDETSVVLGFEDETSRLGKHVGVKITRAMYPHADPDDLGKIIPVVFGTVSRLPALAVDAGLQTSLPVNTSATATSFNLSDTAGWTAGMIFQIDEERFFISGVAGDTVTVIRGHGTTVPVIHLKGAIAWEIKDRFTYLITDHPVDSIPKVRGVVGQAEVDVTAVASRYLGSGASALVSAGQIGGQHPDHPGRACVTLPGYITVEQAVDLLADLIGDVEKTGEYLLTGLIQKYGQYALAGVIQKYGEHWLGGAITMPGEITDYSISQGNHEHTGTLTIAVCPPDDIVAASGSWFISADYAIDGNLNAGGIVNDGASYPATRFKRTQPFSLGGTPTRYRWVYVTGDPVYSAPLKVFTSNVGGGTTKRTDYGPWKSIAYWDWLNVAGYVDVSGAGGRCRVWELWIEVEYDTSPSASPATGVGKPYANRGSLTISGDKTLEGGITVDNGSLNVAGDITVDNGSLGLDGGIFVDRGSLGVTLSGNSTANTLIGDSILCDVVRTRTVSETFDDVVARTGTWPPLQVIGVLPVTYSLNGAITESKRAVDLLTNLALQVRSYFRMSSGTPTLLVRPDALSSIKTIPAVRLSDGRKKLSRRKGDASEVINKIDLLYDRDWSQARSGNAYRGVSSASDEDSINIHGERERPELFMCDFITSQVMAEEVRNFYLGYYKNRPWIIEFDVFLDHAELEFSDIVTLGFLNNAVGIVQQARFSPGDFKKIDVLGLTVEIP